MQQLSQAKSAARQAEPIGRVLLAPLRIGDTAYRTSERVQLTYFVYTAVMACMHPVSTALRWLYCLVPLLIWLLAAIETQRSRRWSSIVRDWSALVLIPIAYWQMDVFRSVPLWHRQIVWRHWDSMLLHGMGLQRGIEAAGPVLPAVLEFFYLSLYAIPPVCLGVIYACGARRNADRFLTTVFLGSMTAYSLLPLVPVLGPRVAFPDLDLPHYSSIWRSINVSILNALDIGTSVFPSGHVAVAFSCAFGLLTVLPEKPAAGRLCLLAASLIFIATVYGRYHYSVDGLCSMAIAFVAWRLEGFIDGI